MNKAYEASPRRTLKHRALIGAVTLAAALGGSASEPSAARANRPVIHESQHPLQARTERRIRRQQPQEIYHGTIGFTQGVQDPITKQWTQQYCQIKNPLLVFRGNLKNEPSQTNVTSGDYDFGSVIDKMGQPVVELIPYSPQRVVIMPETKPPHVIEGILGDGPGSYEFNQLTAPNGSGNPILRGPSGHPEFVALKYLPNK